MSERIPCIACGQDFEAENIKEDGRCTICTHYDFGYWVEESPQKPGFYWAAQSGEVVIVDVIMDDGQLIFNSNLGDGYWPMKEASDYGITHWWSKPENPPPLPDKKNA